MGQNQITAVQSKNVWIALAVLGLSVFNVTQDYQAGGLAAIQETDVSLVLLGLAHLVTRFTDKHARPLRIRSAAYHKRREINKMVSELDKGE